MPKACKSTSDKSRHTLESWLQLGVLRYEKCELEESQVAYETALRLAKRIGDLRGTMEALGGLLRLASERVDGPAVALLKAQLETLMTEHKRKVPPMTWYCLGIVARHENQPKLAQSHFLKYLRAARKQSAELAEGQGEEAVAKAWINLAMSIWHRGHYGRASALVRMILHKYEAQNLKGINGLCYLVLGNIAEKHGDLEAAMRWAQKAHGAFLAEHHWHYHLYVLYAYARISRRQQKYAQAYWYLDLLEKAGGARGFGQLKREIVAEKELLEQDAVDLLIDSRQGVIATRENGKVSLRKQYVLLHILEALTVAHRREGADFDRGLSKAEIIQQVWKEKYHPKVHDNKLYYNINRLRRLIEPDVKKPQYLLNWKEGYRLAPGLKVQFIGGRTSLSASGGLGKEAVKKKHVLKLLSLKEGNG